MKISEMKLTALSLGFLFVFSITTFAQKSLVVSGPMLGPVELRDAKIWLEVAPSVRSVSIQYVKKGQKTWNTIQYKGILGKQFNPIQFTVGGLDFNTTYQYRFIINGSPGSNGGEFTTKDLWQWRKQPPTFSFLAGSCAYFNEPEFDRPGTPYGGDSTIFETMARDKAAFMLWLGDNWYTREVDYHSEWGLWYRASRDRSIPVLQNFLKSMSQFAIWDDHDYGPNNIGKSYVLKEYSREVMKSYWCNPTYGEDGEGIYTSFYWGDVDFFLMDDRWWRDEDRVKDSLDGKPNPGKRMLGEKQMEWLKSALLASWAPFKVVVVGTQVLNQVSPYDKWRNFPSEYDEFMEFLRLYKVPGVIFISGDRHHSEILKLDRPGLYPLYDITISPLTSGTHEFIARERQNPLRVFSLTQKHNYGRITVSGNRGDRTLKVQFVGTKGENLGEWQVSEKELK